MFEIYHQRATDSSSERITTLQDAVDPSGGENR